MRVWAGLAVLATTVSAVAQSGADRTAAQTALGEHRYTEARRLYSAMVQAHPEDIKARVGLADAEVGLNQLESAEDEYRRVTSAEPQNWAVHKKLVLVEARLGRWEDFERERTVLRLARERGAEGISAHESDLIDSFTVKGERWNVREYAEPAGRSQTRYNFEHFGADGRVREYVSLESASGAEAALTAARGSADVAVGQQTPSTVTDWTLNYYTGHAHGRVRMYGSQEPAYRRLRRDIIAWINRQSK